MHPRRFAVRAASVALAIAAAACSSAPAAGLPGAAVHDSDDDLRRLCAILDYVAADYSGAVKDGQVVSPDEYGEQIAFMRDAATLAEKIPDAREGVAAVTSLVAAKADGGQVAEQARALRRQLLDTHGLVLAPPGPPSRERGAALYAQNCAACHGTNGAGDGPQAAPLNPKPRSFLDPEVMADLSPARGFNALTDGIRGTAMPAWGALSPSDRWALAFYVFTFRHDDQAVRRGAAAYEKSGRAVAATPTRLAGISDADLEKSLTTLDAAQRRDALAFLRADAAFHTSGARLDRARQLLAAAIIAYRAGDATAARTAAGAAYLDGFEPHEGTLRARDTALVARVEEMFLGIRNDMSEGKPIGSVERDALQLGALLDRAEETLAGGGGAGVAFGAAAVVILREGVEAALLIMLLLSLARRAGGSTTTADLRAIHLGWLGAAGIGVVTWFAAEPLVALGGERRELMEGIVALLAAAALLLTGHFVLARIDAKHRVDAMKQRLAETTGGRRRLALAGLAFIAVYREAFEVVLFLRAIALDAGASTAAVAGGVAAGTAILVVTVIALLKLGKRLKPGPLLASMGTLLCVLSVVLTGKGVRALQEAGNIPITPIGIPRIELIGLYPTVQGLVAQLAVFMAFFAIVVFSVARQEQPAAR